MTQDRYETAVARYFEAWNAAGAEERAKAVAAAWSEDGGYTDPLADVTGHEAVSALIGGVAEQFPGLVFTLTGSVDGHHDIARFSWALGPEGAPGGTAPVAGSDVITLAEDGRIRSVSGFLDRIPQV
ncbi:nuclear transport factor 2 family protein [Streptomyces sp. MI02-7b]|uniref:nuclear transport factor 2 family protein n=1 Tax=Streptomyces sp. MI02-7b TaxID=462941 RepID=UPI0029ABB907|nr:nuclear transport factor 2 family protein [Streptomyces sp. MI02-7b]MDX3078205.1 nuclear transport factor 2 family protein [Streptomyces sp. MI02-7b]